MPVRLLTQVECDRLAGFPTEVSRADLRASFGLTLADPNTYNVTNGFEGPLNQHGHRGTSHGWKADGLPWKQT